VLHVIASVDPRGGGPIAGVFSSSHVWFQHGHERNIVSLDSPNDPWVVQSPVPTIAVGPRGRWYKFTRSMVPWLRYGYTPNLTLWLKRHADLYDAVIINGLWNYASYGSWRALRKMNVPYYVFPHGMLDPWFQEAYPKKHFFKAIFWRLFEHKVLRDARAVFFTCEEERRLAQASFVPYSCREFVIGYGTQDVSGDAALQREAFLSAVPRVRGRKLILFLGRIHPKKGIDILIHGFSRHAREFPELDVVIAGPDQVGLQTKLMKLATELNVADRVHFPGMLSDDVKWGAFRSAEFFVLPSHQENFGIAIAEALALGTPVLITNKVNIWREVEKDRAGIVVADTLEDFASGIRTMCLLPPTERDFMRCNARSCFLKRYDLENNAMLLLSVMEKFKAKSP
jgi:glycosyltransferase involved in cell wall biosynthesis